MTTLRKAPVDHPVNELIAGRWSPRGLSERRVEPATLAQMFEAARWAPSSFNEQPWSYIVATRDQPEAFEKLGSLLVEGNAWARRGYVLALSVATLGFQRNGKPNVHAWHDVGAASENLFLQAAALGIGMHEMAGFDRERARQVYGLDAGHDPVAMIAIGYPGNPADLPEPLRSREAAPRQRRPIREFVFEGEWGKAAGFAR